MNQEASEARPPTSFPSGGATACTWSQKEAGKAFCSLVNEGLEPRSNVHGRFYLRKGDWEKKVTGLPIVPKEWESLLQKKPVDRQK